MWKPIVAILSTVLMAGAASALPGISLSQPVAEPADDACPLLTRIKYPWLRCTLNEYGGRSFTGATVAANASWETDRRIPLGYEFVEGVGAWFDFGEQPD